MTVIRSLNLRWLWLGYTAGVNSRKRKVESPNKIVNLGKQGVITIPTNQQKVSFFVGTKMGRGKLVQNINFVPLFQYQDKDAHNIKGKKLTAEIGSIETQAGATFTLPFFVCNNLVDNRGVRGYQYKIKYPKQYLTLNSITSYSSWTGSFQYQHDTETGVVLVQGLDENISYEDKIFGFLHFTLAEEVPSKIIVSLQGPTGQGIATDLITKINGTDYYIQPVNLKSGEIKILKEGQEHDYNYPPVGSGSVTLPVIGSNSDNYGKDTDFHFDFDFGLEWIGGGTNAGADLAIKITFGDGSSTVVYIPVKEGLNHYEGYIPIKLPSLKPGPIIIEYWVEPKDPDDLYYWFIKAGALWAFSSEIPREEVGELPIIEPKVECYDDFILKDIVEIETEEEEPTPPTPILTDIDIDEIMQLFDTYELEQYIVLSENEEDLDFSLTDIVEVEFE